MHPSKMVPRRHEKHKALGNMLYLWGKREGFVPSTRGHSARGHSPRMVKNQLSGPKDLFHDDPKDFSYEKKEDMVRALRDFGPVAPAESDQTKTLKEPTRGH